MAAISEHGEVDNNRVQNNHTNSLSMFQCLLSNSTGLSLEEGKTKAERKTLQNIVLQKCRKYIVLSFEKNR